MSLGVRRDLTDLRTTQEVSRQIQKFGRRVSHHRDFLTSLSEFSDSDSIFSKALSFIVKKQRRNDKQSPG